MANGSAIKEYNQDRELEVTEAMIEAGAKIIEDQSPYGLIASDASCTALQVFEAMTQAQIKNV